jgi:hypothetical protein
MTFIELALAAAVSVGGVLILLMLLIDAYVMRD